jgi:CBS domain-containing protein/glyoxylase-like metal-dependent hydrolase (beta-lactamase superfamily II)
MTTVKRPSVPVLRFLGAAETVTGSRFLIDTPQARILVECGLFQGLKPLRLRNWDPFPVDPATIDAVLLTHAHLDHTGYLPALTRDGFRGRVLCTAGTTALSRIVLPDSGHVQEEDAEYANRKGYSKHAPALPFYTEDDAHRALTHFTDVPLESPQEGVPGIHATFRSAGHILGSATITLELDGRRKRTIVFSGDLGRPTHPLLQPPAPLPAADIIVVESTYGNRRHEDVESLRRFTDAIVRTAARGGMVIIPALISAIPRSSFRPQAWRPAGACCIISHTVYPIIGIRSFWSVFKLRAPVDVHCWKERGRSKCSGVIFLCAQRLSTYRHSQRMRTKRKRCIGCARLRARPVVTVSPEQTITAACQLLREQHVGCVVAVEEGKLRGMLTDRDIALNVTGAHKDPQRTTVRDVMTSNPLSIAVNKTVHELTMLMHTHHVRRVPIVDGGGKVVGLVTLDDLLMLLGQEMADIGQGVAGALFYQPSPGGEEASPFPLEGLTSYL